MSSISRNTTARSWLPCSEFLFFIQGGPCGPLAIGAHPSTADQRVSYSAAPKAASGVRTRRARRARWSPCSDRNSQRPPQGTADVTRLKTSRHSSELPTVTREGGSGRCDGMQDTVVRARHSYYTTSTTTATVQPGRRRHPPDWARAGKVADSRALTLRLIKVIDCTRYADDRRLTVRFVSSCGRGADGEAASHRTVAADSGPARRRTGHRGENGMP